MAEQSAVQRGLGACAPVQIRIFGTKPVLRVTFETQDADLGRRGAKQLAAAAAAPA